MPRTMSHLVKHALSRVKAALAKVAARVKAK